MIDDIDISAKVEERSRTVLFTGASLHQGSQIIPQLETEFCAKAEHDARKFQVTNRSGRGTLLTGSMQAASSMQTLQQSISVGKMSVATNVGLISYYKNNRFVYSPWRWAFIEQTATTFTRLVLILRDQRRPFCVRIGRPRTTFFQDDSINSRSRQTPRYRAYGAVGNTGYRKRKAILQISDAAIAPHAI